MKSTTLTKAAHEKILARAQQHILKGGGIVPDDGGSDWEDAVGSIAADVFGAAKASAAFEKLIKGFDYDQHEAIYAAAWWLVNVHQDAAFAFGAAVGIQITKGRE